MLTYVTKLTNVGLLTYVDLLSYVDPLSYVAKLTLRLHTMTRAVGALAVGTLALALALTGRPGLALAP